MTTTETLTQKLNRESAHADRLAAQCDDPAGRRAWIQRRISAGLPVRPDAAPLETVVARVDGHIPIYLREYAKTMQQAADRIAELEARSVTFQAERNDDGLLYLRQNWVDGEGGDVSFSLNCGAGTGAPLMDLTVTVGDVRVTEVVNIVDGLTAWVDRLAAEARQGEAS
jgi:hypothetical protein